MWLDSSMAKNCGCGITLSAKNRDGMCLPCLRKGSSPERVMTEVRRLLVRPEIRSSFANARPHAFLVALRDELGMSQRRIGTYTEISQSTISRYLAGPRDADRDMMLKLVDGFNLPRALVIPEHEADAAAVKGAPRSAGPLGEMTPGATAEWRENEMTIDEIDKALADLRVAVPEVQRLNDLEGGSARLRVWASEFVDLADQVTQQNLDGQRERIAAQLKSELSMLTGWLNYDGGDQAKTRQYWNTALVHAQLSENPLHEVYALESLAAQATYYLARPKEAVAFARRAQTLSGASSSPRIRSLLELREACAWAVMNDERQFMRHYKLAEAYFDRSNHENDPEWINFYGESELRGLFALAMNDLQKPAVAETHFATAFAEVEDGFSRNRLYYASMLAKTRLLLGDATGAAEVADERFFVEAADTGSVRTRNHAYGILTLAAASQTADARIIRERAIAADYLRDTDG